MGPHWSDVRCISLELVTNAKPLWTQRGHTCHCQADQHREEGYLTLSEPLTLTIRRDPTNDDETPHHNSWPTSGLQSVRE